MALSHALGRDLAVNDSTTGLPGVITGVGEQKSDTNTRTVIVRAPLAVLESLVPAKGASHADCGWVPENYFVSSARLSSSDGEGIITLECISPGDDSQQAPIAPSLIQYQILMSEVQTDLIAHPDITKNRSTVELCLKWLATDEARRIDDQGDYCWEDVDGSRQKIVGQAAVRFCDAWMHGIKTYNRYFPIIEKQSIYTRVPGLTLGGTQGSNPLSITGGTAKFSADIGTFSAPDISLGKYDATGWFKSGDDYRSSGRAFTRSEQWTWTPDGKDSKYAWIYGARASGGGGAANPNGGAS